MSTTSNIPTANIPAANIPSRPATGFLQRTAPTVAVAISEQRVRGESPPKQAARTAGQPTASTSR